MNGNPSARDSVCSRPPVSHLAALSRFDSRSKARVIIEDCRAFDDETRQAIGELLALGEQKGFGITFSRDPAGWAVG
jgi:hypothetical protein